MAKNVIVLASGETERLALPRLLSHLRDRGVSPVEVRIPRGNGALSVRVAENLVKDAWYERPGAAPDKFVILLDVDGKSPDDVMEPFRTLSKRLGSEIGATVLYAYAQWHLEAWYFADAQGLRGYLGGRALGNVDTSRPDGIQNPKLHLKHLLDEVYTARISEKIASRLDATTIAERSPSFKGFVEAVMNGPSRGGAS